MLAAKTHQLKKGSIKPTKVEYNSRRYLSMALNLIPILYLPFTFQSCMNKVSMYLESRYKIWSK